jgi:hypothetical protein
LSEFIDFLGTQRHETYNTKILASEQPETTRKLIQKSIHLHFPEVNVKGCGELTLIPPVGMDILLSSIFHAISSLLNEGDGQSVITITAQIKDQRAMIVFTRTLFDQKSLKEKSPSIDSTILDYLLSNSPLRYQLLPPLNATSSVVLSWKQTTDERVKNHN